MKTFLFSPFVLAALGAARLAQAEPADQQARKIEREAIEFHYLGMQFKQAERLLSSAVSLCETQPCSDPVRAHLHLSLGFVQGAGKGDQQLAREEFVRGLRIDPKAQLTGSMATPTLLSIFEEAREATKNFHATASSAYVPGLASGGAITPREEETLNGTEDRPPEPAPAPPKDSGPGPNHVELSFAPDLAFVSAKDVCSPPPAGETSRWVCLDETGSPYAGRPQPNLDNNNVKLGMSLSTVRLLAGYRRTVAPRWDVGLRLGFAFRGGPTPPGGSGFLPLHAEARLTFRPLSHDLGALHLRPFAVGSAGVMEVDSSVNVNVVEVPCSVNPSSRCARKLQAWYRAGFGFLGLAGGLEIPAGQSQSFIFATRLSYTIGSPELVISPELGYEQRF
jgi:hypothetical protein